MMNKTGISIPSYIIVGTVLGFKTQKTKIDSAMFRLNGSA